MMIAQNTTRLMAIGGCSFFARTAPATAMAADTPHTAPPAPRVAAKRLSRPSLVATKKITRKVMIETSDACRMATGPAQTISMNGKVAPSSTMPSLM